MSELGTRGAFLEAGFWFVQQATQLPGVTRIALLGSLTTERRRPKDIDLLLTVSDSADLEPVAALGRRLKGRMQSHGRGADIFLASERGGYIGRTCSWTRCRPGIRASCDALHCGARPYLHDDFNTVRLSDTLVSQPPLDLWPVVVRRCVVPADVEEFLGKFATPPNNGLQRTAGAHVRGRRTSTSDRRA